MTAPLRVAVLTPDPAAPRYADRWRPAFEGYARALAAAGAQVRPCPWTQAPAPDVDGHLAVLAWGYHFAPAAWRARLEGWPASAPLVNAPALLGWNSDKRYLAELERAGVATVPTVFTACADAPAIAGAAERFGGGELVVKPQVSAGAHATFRLTPGDVEAATRAAQIGPAMIQPFLPAVGGEGELSLFMFGGAPAHAVAKRAASGDFRIHPQFGGVFTALEPDADMLALASAALAACPRPPAYARVDMVRDPHGRLRLMELELIEPDLYLHMAPDGGAGWARAVLGAIAAASAQPGSGPPASTGT